MAFCAIPASVSPEDDLSYIATEENADTIYLNNGRSISGIISRESNASVELETSGGSMIISRSQIKRINRISPETLTELKNKWKEHKAMLEANKKVFEESREKRLKAYGEQVKEEAIYNMSAHYEENEVKITRDPVSKAMLVDTMLNGEIKAMLMVDTGADIMVLSKEIGGKLGVDMSPESEKDIQELRVTGGKTIKVRIIVLKSVAIEKVEEKDVLAAVLLEESTSMDIKDGLLGRSFLDRFSIKVDTNKMSMTLQKVK